MSEFTLTRQNIKAGKYIGILSTRARVKAPPKIAVRLLDAVLGDAQVTADETRDRTWNVEAAIPASVLNEGVQTFVLHEQVSGDTLDSFAIVAGTPLQDDLRAEMALLRGELEMLKKSFRKHTARKKR